MTGFTFERIKMTTFVSLISGSSGNATFISDGKTNLLIDCGMSGKKLKEALHAIDVMPESIDALLLTHEHIDHTRGAGIVSRRYNIPVYATEGTCSAMDVGKIEDVNLVTEETEFEIGSISVKPFAIPHDAKQPVGYCPLTILGNYFLLYRYQYLSYLIDKAASFDLFLEIFCSLLLFSACCPQNIPFHIAHTRITMCRLETSEIGKQGL